MKEKKNVRSRAELTVSHPSDPFVINSDVIALMTDDELYTRLISLESERAAAISLRLDPKLWEIEASYVKREQQIRQERIRQHDEFLLSCSEQEQFIEDEERYPVADLDNRAFMFWN